MTSGKCDERCIISLVSNRVSRVFLETSSCIIYKQRETFGKFYQSWIVSLASYSVSGVFL